MKPFLRFSIVFGSSYFEVKDQNQNGNPDFVYTKGDNADLLIVKKNIMVLGYLSTLRSIILPKNTFILHMVPQK